MLDPVTLTALSSSYRNLVATDGYSGGTKGFVPEGLRVEKHARAVLWKARDAERLATQNQNRTGLYYRDQVLNTSSYPWSAIGRLAFKKYEGDSSGWCTASLIGRNTILTASHCYPWGYGPGRWMRFIPGYNNGSEPYGRSYVTKCRGVKNTFNVTGIDYIVCQLCEPLGDKAGWMGTQWWDDSNEYMNKSWRSSGYPSDSFRGRAQMLLSNINLTDVDLHADTGKELESRIFASPGWSGGPMWEFMGGMPKIVGVCSGSEKDCSESTQGCYGAEGVLDIDTFHDVSAGGRLMTDLATYAFAHWQDDGEDSDDQDYLNDNQAAS
ncbi:SPT3 Dosage dependent suppressor of Ty-induced promoter mutations-like protein [Paecilomyces lecythidis]|uniref:Serine protease n=1 Tax=Paecilomyces lecythidis TaxID=3004212 RepID=A0ABR3XHH2_9EURO